MTPGQVFVAVLLASLLGFGGLGSLPVLRGQLSGAGVVTPDTVVLNALAVGNISPGPNGLYLVAVGYFVAGVPGGLAAFAALLLPPLLVLVLDKVRNRLTHHRRFRAVLRSLSLAVVALLAQTATSLVAHAATTVEMAALVLAGTALLILRIPPLLGVLGAIAVGLLLH